MRKLLIIASFIFVGLAINGCYKIHHNYIVKGEWYLNSLEIDGGSTNFMNGVLPGYLDTTGKDQAYIDIMKSILPGYVSPAGEIKGYYRIYMLDNGLVRTEYYVQDTLNYFRTGTWDLLSPDSIYLNVDDYSNGTFYIELINKEEMILSTDHNFVRFFNMGDVKTVIRSSRNKPTSQESTMP